MTPPADDDLQARLDAAVEGVVAAANRGERPWVGMGAWRFGFPMHWRTGDPIRGLGALILWHQQPMHGGTFGWKEGDDPAHPRSAVVPVRGRRGERPTLLVRWPRIAQSPPQIPVFNLQHVDDVIHELGPHQPADPAQLRELALAFTATLRRADPGPLPHAPGPWTAEGLRRACAVALLVADAAYARQVGKLFIGAPLLRARADVRALFPPELCIPATEEAPPTLREGRALSLGHGCGQLPLQSTAKLRLDRVFDRGGVVRGAARVWACLKELGIVATGDAATDARLLGRALGRALATMPRALPWQASRPEATAWRALRTKVLRATWFHHRAVLTGADLGLIGERFVWRRLVPRLVHALTRSAQGGPEYVTAPAAETNTPGAAKPPSPIKQRRRLVALRQKRGAARFTPKQYAFREGLGGTKLEGVPLLSLFDAMGPQGSSSPVRVAELLTLVKAAGELSYTRMSLPKASGGWRWLDVPTPALAEAQRKLMAALAPASPWNGSAVGFARWRSPALHARAHEGAVAALVVDLRDFFGSVRPRHLWWLFTDNSLLADGTAEQRKQLLHAFFAGKPGGVRWLPQGAPSSPWLANLAAQPLDRRVRAWARKWGADHHCTVRYSRYADDLCLSVAGLDEGKVQRTFLDEAEAEVTAGVEARGWAIASHKSRRWMSADRTPLVLCGVEVPLAIAGACRLPREARRRARAALHAMRQGGQYDARAHGQLAWAFGATGALSWLPWTSAPLDQLAAEMAGQALGEAVLSGLADDTEGTLG